MTKPMVHAYVLHWNAPSKVKAALQALTKSRDVDLSVTLVDNQSDESSLVALNTGVPDSVRVVTMPRNLGYAGAANWSIQDGLKALGHQHGYIVIMAHDAVIMPDSLALISAAMDDDPQIGAAAAIVTYADGELFHGGSWSWTGGARAATGPVPKQVVSRAWLGGQLMMLRPSMLREVGGLDQSLFAYFEDVEYGLRIVDHGWRLAVVPTAGVREQGQTLPSPLRNYLNGRNELRVMLRRRSWLVAARVLARDARRSLRPAPVETTQSRRCLRRAILDGLLMREGEIPKSVLAASKSR